MLDSRIAETGIAPLDALEHFQRRSGDMGALASFAGYCRALAGEHNVSALELQHYPGFTDRITAEYAQALMQRTGVASALVLHRVGVIPAGDCIVLVAATSQHRREAFQFVEQMMDWLKTDAPLWKREHSDSGARWIEPTAADYERREKLS